MVKWLMTERELNGLVANSAQVQRAMDAGAFRVHALAEQRLLDHHYSGAAQIVTERVSSPRIRGRVDRKIILRDTGSVTDGVANTALSIEFGRAPYVDQYGVEYGGMQGLYILTMAAAMAAKKPPKFKGNSLNKKYKPRKYTNRMFLEQGISREARERGAR